MLSLVAADNMNRASEQSQLTCANGYVCHFACGPVARAPSLRSRASKGLLVTSHISAAMISRGAAVWAQMILAESARLQEL